MWAHWWPWVPGGAGEGETGAWETPGDGGAALLHRQLCLCCYGEETAAQFWLKGSEKRFNGGWLLISNQHIITVSIYQHSYQLKPVPFWLKLKTKNTTCIC